MGIEFIYPEFEVVRNENRCIACRVCERQCANKIGIGKRQPQHYLFGALFPSFTPYVRLSTHTAFHQE